MLLQFLLQENLLIEEIKNGNISEAKRLLSEHSASAGDLISEDWNLIEEDGNII